MAPAFLHPLLPEKVVYISIFEQELCNETLVEASSEAFPLDKTGLNHLLCNVSSSSLDQD